MSTPNFLQMCGLGVRGACQPPGATKLVDGIHLRWGFQLSRGFPLGGYFLFRRKSTSKTTTPVSGNAAGGGLAGAPAGGGWQSTPGIVSSGPILLPIVSDHPQLPGWWPGRDPKSGHGNSGTVADLANRASKAWDAAKGRINYEDASSAQSGFPQLHQLLCKLAEGHPAGAAISSLTVPAVIEADSGGLQVAVPKPTPGDPDLLGLMLLRAMDPAYAQLIGLYFVDTTATPGQLWDYTLLADRGAAFAGSLRAALAWLNQDGAAAPRAQLDVDVAWLLGMECKPAGQLPPPASPVRAYALPAANRPVDGGGAEAVEAATMTVGLRWVAPKVPNVVGLDTAAGALAWTVERAALAKGPLKPPEAPLAATKFAKSNPKYELAHMYQYMLASPRLTIDVPEKDLPPDKANYQPPVGWPPFQLGFVDKPLDEGWYAWRVTATDLFGRRSVPSDPAQWWSWDSGLSASKIAADPTLWYTQAPWAKSPGTNVCVHPTAVGLFDKVAPPPPQGLWAQVTDPCDPLAVKDDAWNARYCANTSKPDQFYLRLRWHWTLAQHRQAPDAAWFRIYVRSGLVNTRFGQVTAVQAGNGQLDIDTDLDFHFTSGSLAGAVLRVNGRGFTVTSGQVLQSGGLHLCCKLPDGQIEAAAAVARIRPGLSCALILQGPQHPGWHTPDSVRDGSWMRINRVAVGWDNSGTKATVFRPVRLGRSDLSPKDRPEDDMLIGGHATLLTDGVQVDGLQQLNGIDVGLHVLLLRKAQPSDGGYPRLDDLTGACAVAFSGVKRDNRYFYVSKEQFALARVPADWFAKVGQAEPEIRWAVGDLSKSYDVWLPLDAQLLPEPTAAQGKTWLQAMVTTVDDKEHSLDWLDKNGNGDPYGKGGVAGNEGQPAGLQSVFRVRRAIPDAPAVVWPSSCLASEPDGDGRSFFTVRWPKVGLSVRILRASADSVFHADYENRGPSSMGTDPVGTYLKQNWGGSGAKPKFSKVREIYEGLDGKLQQTIASTKELAGAFSAVHSAPLGDAACPDALGPADPAEFVVKPTERCAYVDTLPGRVPGVYFYRLQTIDAAGNVSALGPASPPVTVPEVFVPSAPVIIEAYAGTPEMKKELADLRVAEAAYAKDKSLPKPMAEWEILEKYSGMVTLVWGLPKSEDARLSGWHVHQTDSEGSWLCTSVPNLHFGSAMTDLGNNYTAFRPSITAQLITGFQASTRVVYHVAAIGTQGQASAISAPAVITASWPNPATSVVLLKDSSKSLDSGMLHLAWSSSSSTILVQCVTRAGDNDTWTPTSDWIPAMNGAADVPRPEMPFEVALLVRDAMGMVGRTPSLIYSGTIQ